MAKKKPLPAPPAAAALPKTTGLWVWATLLWGLWALWSFDDKFHLNLNAVSALMDDLLTVSWNHVLPMAGSYFITTILFLGTLLSVYSWGLYCVPKDPALTAQDRATFAFAAGFFLLMLLNLGLSFGGVIHKPLFLGILVLSAGGGAYLQRTALLELKTLVGSWVTRVASSPVELLVVLFSCMILVLCFVPELFYDSLVYHLGLPNLYVQEGRWVDTPYVYFSRFPMAMHTLYIWALALGDDSLAKLINGAVLAVGLSGVYSLCRRAGMPKGGPWAVLLLLSMPVLQMNNWSTAIDSALGAYTLVTVLSFLFWRQSLDVRWLVYCAAAAGMTFGIKYTGVIIPIMIFLMMPLATRTFPWAPRLRAMVLFGAIVTFTMLPWFVRNAVTTGNPLYPIASSIIPSRGMHVGKMEDEKNIMKGYPPHSVMDFIQLPWELSTRELDSFNFIGPLTLGLLPLLMLLWRIRKQLPVETQWITLGTVLYFGMTLFATRQIRYLLPGFFLMSVGLGGGIAVALERRPTAGRFLASFVVLGALYQGGWIINLLQNAYRPMAVLAGEVSRQDYTSVIHPGLNPWPWEALRPAILQLPTSARILFVGQEKVHRCPRPYVYSSVHDHTQLVLWANASRTPEEFFALVRASGITHLLFNHPESARLTPYKLFEWNDQGRRNFNDFLQNHLRLVAKATTPPAPDALALYALTDTPPSPVEMFQMNPGYGDAYNRGTHG